MKGKNSRMYCQKNSKNLWYDLNKSTKGRKSIPPHIDGKSDDAAIADVFEEKPRSFYHSVPLDEECMQKLIELESYNQENNAIRSEDICTVISKLTYNKSDHDTGLFSNHVIFAPKLWKIHLALLM